MGVNATKVYVGRPDQLTTGAVLTAPLTTTGPENAASALDEAFTSSGYVSEDGVSLSPELSTTEIVDWSGANIRTVLESFNGTIDFSLIQLDYEGAVQAVGAEHVTRVAATAEHGEQLKISLGNHLPESKSWVFKMKDGKAKMLIYVPNGQVTSLEEMSFTSSDAIALGMTISCYDDGTGNSIYVMTDDGEVVSA